MIHFSCHKAIAKEQNVDMCRLFPRKLVVKLITDLKTLTTKLADSVLSNIKQYFYIISLRHDELNLSASSVIAVS